MAKASQFPPPDLQKIGAEVAQLLKDSQRTVAVAETAAGGLISSTLLAQPGASKYYKGGLTLYTLESRIAFADWTQADIDNYKGPTPDIVKGLADAVRAKLKSTFVVSESGTAGPTGGSTRNRTPGYVALAVSSESGTITKEVETGLGTDREANMIAFAVEGLQLLKEALKSDTKL